MRQIQITIAIFFSVLLLISCDSKQKDVKVETPDALQDDKLEIKSYRSSGNLTEELYQDLVKAKPELKRLEDELDGSKSKPDELNEIFNNYNYKSNSYYRSANLVSNSITDSVLKIKISELITKSSKRYDQNIGELNSLIKQIALNNTTLNDHHAVLKIVMTLPLIEKYQKDNLPSTKDFKDVIKHQDNIIELIDSLTPRY